MRFRRASLVSPSLVSGIFQTPFSAPLGFPPRPLAGNSTPPAPELPHRTPFGDRGGHDRASDGLRSGGGGTRRGRRSPLVAYLTAAESGDEMVPELRAELARRVPGYMVGRSSSSSDFLSPRTARSIAPLCRRPASCARPTPGTWPRAPRSKSGCSSISLAPKRWFGADSLKSDRPRSPNDPGCRRRRPRSQRRSSRRCSNLRDATCCLTLARAVRTSWRFEPESCLDSDPRGLRGHERQEANLNPLAERRSDATEHGEGMSLVIVLFEPSSLSGAVSLSGARRRLRGADDGPQGEAGPGMDGAAQLPGNSHVGRGGAASQRSERHGERGLAFRIGASLQARGRVHRRRLRHPLRDSDAVLPAEDARRLRLRSYPTGPRLGIAVPEDLASPVFFWQVPGEVGRGTPAEEGHGGCGRSAGQGA